MSTAPSGAVLIRAEVSAAILLRLSIDFELEQFQEKCVTAFRPEWHKNKQIERLRRFHCHGMRSKELCGPHWMADQRVIMSAA